MLSKFNYFINKVLNIFCVILFIAIFIIMDLGIIFRSLGYPLFWTDELCRYLFIWAIFIQVVILVNKKQHIGVDWFIGFFSSKYKIILSKIVILVQLIFVILLMYYGVRMMILTSDIPTTSLNLPWSLVYLSIVISSIFMSISFLLQLIDGNKGFEKQ